MATADFAAGRLNPYFAAFSVPIPPSTCARSDTSLSFILPVGTVERGTVVRHSRTTIDRGCDAGLLRVRPVTRRQPRRSQPRAPRAARVPCSATREFGTTPAPRRPRAAGRGRARGAGVELGGGPAGRGRARSAGPPVSSSAASAAAMLASSASVAIAVAELPLDGRASGRRRRVGGALLVEHRVGRTRR